MPCSKTVQRKTPFPVSLIWEMVGWCLMHPEGLLSISTTSNGLFSMMQNSFPSSFRGARLSNTGLPSKLSLNADQCFYARCVWTTWTNNFADVTGLFSFFSPDRFHIAICRFLNLRFCFSSPEFSAYSLSLYETACAYKDDGNVYRKLPLLIKIPILCTIKFPFRHLVFPILWFRFFHFPFLWILILTFRKSIQAFIKFTSLKCSLAAFIFLIVSPPAFASDSRKISVCVSEFLLSRFVFSTVVNYLTAVAVFLYRNVALLCL